MSFATAIGQTFTGVVGHHGRKHLPAHRGAVPAANPEAVTVSAPRPRHAPTAASLDASSADQRLELQQWSAVLILGVGLNR